MIAIRTYELNDHAPVRALFVKVNEYLAPAHLRDAFQAYIERSLAEEIDRIPDYYAQRRGGFWVAEVRRDDATSQIVGMFGLEQVAPGMAELRRMYVDPAARRMGLGRTMLDAAERETRQLGCHSLTLSTSELQGPALALYRGSGYRLVREEIAQGTGTLKTVGAGLRRFYFEKSLRT